MSQFFQIHPDNPQVRLISQAVDILRKGGVIIYPTDSGYALGCHLDDKNATERITRLRGFDGKHNYTLVCADLSDIATYAEVNTSAYRMLKSHTPGPYTFILPATREVPRRLQQPKRKTIGIRVPDNQITRDLISAHGEAIMSATLIPAGETEPLLDPYDMRERFEHEVDLIIDGGYCGMEPTSVVDLSQGQPQIIRRGLGDVSLFDV